ncbi:hypothetical protein FIBSPDRAFT_1054864 [Athelia psychrophila]|uniref:Major facilitator superfamily (MFS) profile domain-containing protein n=1 Tax=Athelia psychrophila TaxID=1759441 RepID=A0A167UPR8_9AGAM|nr:hypothetical protein FIBSPDRAFT_1054864 [Fibularhizoctonia sp. CBS 109695]
MRLHGCSGLGVAGWLAWSCDGIDFFSASLSVPNLQAPFGKSVYILRSIGAVVFSVINDRFSCNLSGVAVGGIWGLSASSALENLPVELCGLASGGLHQGCAVGYLIAAAVYLYLVPEQSRGWRALLGRRWHQHVRRVPPRAPARIGDVSEGKGD